MDEIYQRGASAGLSIFEFFKSTQFDNTIAKIDDFRQQCQSIGSSCFCDAFISVIEENVFDISAFLDAIKKLGEKAVNIAMEALQNFVLGIIETMLLIYLLFQKIFQG